MLLSKLNTASAIFISWWRHSDLIPEGSDCHSACIATLLAHPTIPALCFHPPLHSVIYNQSSPSHYLLILFFRFHSAIFETFLNKNKTQHKFRPTYTYLLQFTQLLCFHYYNSPTRESSPSSEAEPLPSDWF